LSGTFGPPRAFVENDAPGIVESGDAEMNPSKPSFLLKLLPSMTDLAFVMPLVFLYGRMRGAKTLLGDGDTGWHLRTGEWILANGRVPDRDIFSFTRSGQPWFAWEWLWDLIFGWLHLHAGMAAVLAGSSVVLALTFALLFRLARRKSGDAVVALAMTLLAAAGSTGHWLARPHLFTMLFTVLFCWILERAKPDAGRLLWLLPALSVLWTNLHGGFFVGIMLIAAYGAGELAVLLRQADPAERRTAIQRCCRYLLAAAGCFLASFLNPYGYHLHAHIFSYLSDSFFRVNITEFQSLNFQNPQARYFEILLLTGGVAALRHLRQWRLAWPLLFGAWAHLALYSARNVEIFVLLAAPPAAETLAEGWRRAAGAPWASWIKRSLAALRDLTNELGAMDAVPRVHALSAMAVLVLVAVLYAPGTPSRCKAEYDPTSYPVAAGALLEEAGLIRSVFTQDLWGGYLIYQGYPRVRVFMDGRSDFYGAAFAKEYIYAMGVRPGWEQYLARYGVDTILLPPDAPLAGALKQSSAWRLIYDDGVALVFRLAGAPVVRLAPAFAKASLTSRR
jgi:hypothetical protein